MVMTLEEAQAIVDTGKAERYLAHFAVNSLILQMIRERGKTLDISDEYYDAALVASLALTKMLKGPDARKLLGLKRRPRGASLKAADFPMGSDAHSIAERVASGDIEKSSGVDALEDVLGKSDIYPNRKTSTRLLNEMTEATELVWGLYDWLDGDPPHEEK